MSFPRIIVYLLGIILLCLLAAGAIIYPRLPLLAERQAEKLLSEYGVEDVTLQRPSLRRDHLQIEKLQLRGELDGLVFDATLSAIDLQYNWRRLLDGQLGALLLDHVKLIVEQLPVEEDVAAVPVDVEQLLAQANISLLPLQSLEVAVLELEYRAPDMTPVSASGSLQWGEQLSLGLTSSYLGSQIRSQVQTGSDASSLDFNLAVADVDNSFIELTARLQRESEESWRWTLRGALEWEALLAWAREFEDFGIALNTAAIEALAVRGGSVFEGDILHPNTVLTAPTGAMEPLDQFEAKMRLQNTISRLDFPPMVDALTGEITGSLGLQAGHLSLVFDGIRIAGAVHSQQLSLPEESRQWLGWPDLVPVTLSSPAGVELASGANGTWSIKLHDTDFTLGDPRSQLRLQRLKLETSIAAGEQPRLDIAASTSLATRLRKTQLPSMELTLQHQGPLERGQVNLQLVDTAESLRVMIDGTGNLKNGSGRYTFTAHSLDLPYAVSSTLPLLRKLDVAKLDLELLSGNFKLESVVQSRGLTLADWRMTSTLSASDISGKFNEYQFEDMALEANWRGVDQWQTTSPAEFTIGKLNVGFDISSLRAKLALPRPTAPAQPVVRIEQFSAQLFGGNVYLPEPRTWDFAASSNQMTLKAEQWQLAQLVALQQDQQIEAQGNLEGELPLTMSDGRIIIEKGYLKARAPGGDIRYIPNAASAALAQSSPELGMAMDLLRDFRYEVLSSEVELDKQGNLILGLSLVGRNPSQFDGRQVNFNINLEQNLDPLLQSLRLSDTLVENIEGKLQ